MLIIDDNEGALHTLAASLPANAFDVEEAASGATGLALARQGGLHAIVADQCLPDLTGMEVLAQLRALGSSLPFVMMSGWPTPELKARAEELGASDFLTKPIGVDELPQVIRRAVQREFTPAEADIVGRVEPPSRAVTDIRRIVAGLVEQGHARGETATNVNTAGEPHRWFLHALVRAVAYKPLCVRELLHVASAIRQVVQAPCDTSSWDVATRVHDALSRAGRGDVRRPLHSRIVGALAHLASLEGAELKISEPDLAHEVGMGVSRLSRLLRSQTGLDFRQWVRGLRMRQALEQLAQTNRDVSEVSASLGWRSTGQFDRDFHELFGLTPRSFREILRRSNPAADSPE